MQVFYFNDESQAVRVRVLNQDGSDLWFDLQPATGDVFTIDAPASSIPYVKKWAKMVMISCIDPACLAQLQLNTQCGVSCD